MKIECVKQNIIENVFITEKATGKNLTLPVLGCVLLSARKNLFIIRATNLELGIEIKVQAKVIMEGDIAVPGNILYNVINNIRDTSITLESVEGNLKITSLGSSTLIKSYSTTDFPTLPVVKDDKIFSIPANDILKGLQSVWFSASTSTIKPELSSVYVYTNDKKIFFVATDSFRLSEKIIIIKNIPDFEPILIPIRNIQNIIKVFEYLNDTPITISLTDNQISFTTESVYLTSRLIDGIFPDYKQIIPKGSSTEAIILKQDLVDTLKKVNVFSDKFNQVHFTLGVQKKDFSLSSHNNDVGETTELLDGALKGEDIEINFNHKYISDALPLISSDSVALSFNGMGKPLVIRGISDTSYLYLVMPMNR